MSLGRGRIEPPDGDDEDGPRETTAMLWLAGVNERLRLLTWMIGANLVLVIALVCMALLR
jgi:hypothetical protein